MRKIAIPLITLGIGIAIGFGGAHVSATSISPDGSWTLQYCRASKHGMSRDGVYYTGIKTTLYVENGQSRECKRLW